jgi:hypothetical protein
MDLLPAENFDLAKFERVSSFLYADPNVLTSPQSSFDGLEKLEISKIWPVNSAEIRNIQVVYAAESEGVDIIEFFGPEPNFFGSGDGLMADDDEELMITIPLNPAVVHQLRELSASPLHRAYLQNIVFAGHGPTCRFEQFVVTWLRLCPKLCLNVTRRSWLELAEGFKLINGEIYYPEIVRIPSQTGDYEKFFNGLLGPILLQDAADSSPSSSAAAVVSSNETTTSTVVAAPTEHSPIASMELAFDLSSAAEEFEQPYVTVIPDDVLQNDTTAINATTTAKIDFAPMPMNASVSQSEVKSPITSTDSPATLSTTPVAGFYIKVPSLAITSVLLPLFILIVCILTVLKLGKSIFSEIIKALKRQGLYSLLESKEKIHFF